MRNTFFINNPQQPVKKTNVQDKKTHSGKRIAESGFCDASFAAKRLNAPPRMWGAKRLIGWGRRPLKIYLQPTPFIDSDSPEVIEFARSAISNTGTDIEQGVKLYYAVRELVRYNPYGIGFDPARYKASWVLQKKIGFCIQKSILLAAAARVVGIPSRLGFADVRNHLATERLKNLMRTDEFIFHGYTELYLAGKWVKATPAFNLGLCQRFGVKPLEFDGRNDSIFHPFDQTGNKHMEYIRDYGQFADFPLEKMKKAFKAGYPHLYKKDGLGWPGEGDFEQEAAVT